MSAHTPGPWCKGDSDLPVSKVAICGGDRNHPTIARLVLAKSVGMPIDEALANQSLIAAAPDLLAALKWVANGGARDDTPQMWTAVNAAIAKAEGRQ